MPENVQKLAKAMRDRVARGLYAEAAIVMKNSMERTPVDTGALRASHALSDPKPDGFLVSIQIMVGGSAAPYAWYVHENLSVSHAVGQAKYLESAVNDALPGLCDRVAARARL